MKVQCERGYLVLAVNNSTTDYVECARRLSRSLKQWHPEAKVCLLTDAIIEDPDFDYIRVLPYGDKSTGEWKLQNDWQAFFASPFRQTIKLEADMLVASPVDHWWTLFENREVVISQGCRDFYDQHSDCRRYRKTFDTNDLPDLYNAVTYWRLGTEAQEFFNTVRQIFEHWDRFRQLLKFPDEHPTTDVVYAMAAKILGVENYTLPSGLGPQIVHMKKGIVPTDSENWTENLVWEHTDPGFRINTVAQWGFVHYHVKDWSQ